MATKTKKAKKSTKSKVSKTKKTNKPMDVYERARQNAEARKFSGGADFFKPAIGDNTIRPIPFEHTDEDGVTATHLEVPETVHWVSLESKNTKIRCAGPRDDCPICNLEGQVSERTWKDIKVQTKYLLNVVVRKERNNDLDEDTMMIGQFAKSVLDGDSREDNSKGLIDYIGILKDCLHPSKGRDFVIRKTGKGYKTKYLVTPVKKPRAVGVTTSPSDLIARMKEVNMETLQEAADMLLKVAS